MASSSGFEVRTIRPEELPTAVELDASAFAFDPPAAYLADDVLPELEVDRFTAVFDPDLDGLMVGCGAILTKRLSVPGREPIPAAAVTWVSVRPGHRRRGILREIMRHQLHGLHEAGGEAIAILTASEAAIYGRFGYGQASGRVRIEIPTRSELQPGLGADSIQPGPGADSIQPGPGANSIQPGPGADWTQPGLGAGRAVDRIREVPRATALPLIKDIYDRVAPGFPGHLSRSSATWKHLYSDHEVAKAGASALRFALHRDGFVAYRVQLASNDRGADSTVLVHEFCAATPAARIALWSHLLNFDLMARVRFGRGNPDDPIQDMLVSRRGTFSANGDHLWVRIIDLHRAIGLRSYRVPADLLVEVRDAFCPWNAGVHRWQLGPHGGTSSRADGDRPEIRLDIADLGAAWLGGTPISRLVAAGRVSGGTGALALLDLALSTSAQPYCPEGF